MSIPNCGPTWRVSALVGLIFKRMGKLRYLSWTLPSCFELVNTPLKVLDVSTLVWLNISGWIANFTEADLYESTQVITNREFVLNDFTGKFILNGTAFKTDMNFCADTEVVARRTDANASKRIFVFILIDLCAPGARYMPPGIHMLQTFVKRINQLKGKSRQYRE